MWGKISELIKTDRKEEWLGTDRLSVRHTKLLFISPNKSYLHILSLTLSLSPLSFFLLVLLVPWNFYFLILWLFFSPTPSLNSIPPLLSRNKNKNFDVVLKLFCSLYTLQSPCETLKTTFLIKKSCFDVEFGRLACNPFNKINQFAYFVFLIQDGVLFNALYHSF